MHSALRTALTLVIAASWHGRAEGQLLPGGAPPFIATPYPIGEAMLDLAAVGEGDLVYDLGSGDGRLVIAAALRGARAVGIEYDRDLIALSTRNSAEAGVASLARFSHGDIFEAEVHSADVVLVYLSAEFNLRLRPRLLEQLAPGSRIVSHAFHMGDWQPDSTVTLGRGASRATLFAWTVPANVDGFWRLLLEGQEELNLELRQEFQIVSGTAWRGEVRHAVSGRIRGREIILELRPESDELPGAVSLSGRIGDSGMDGLARGRGGSLPGRWSARRFTGGSPARQ